MITKRSPMCSVRVTRGGFTLAELLVSMAVLIIITLMLTQLMTNATATPPPDTFDTRPVVTSTAAQIGDNNFPPNPSLTFHYPIGSSSPQYTFVKAVQFSPRGECIITNSNYTPARIAEVGLVPTHGATAPTSTPPNVSAVQINGFVGAVKIYRR